MSSYAVTGVSKGIGFEFLQQLSNDPKNTVIGIVRNKPATETEVAKLGRPNIHIVQGDLDNYASLQRAAEETSKIVGGKLDYIIANAGNVSDVSAFDALGTMGKTPTVLEDDMLGLFRTNAIGNVHLINLFMPLILKGHAKKVIAISSGMADDILTAKHNLAFAAPYAMSKAALNTAIAKFSAEYAEHGVLVMAICPGVVDVGRKEQQSPEKMEKMMVTFGKFQEYAPHFKAPATPQESVRDILSVIAKSTVAKDGGSFISHLGTKQWL